MVKEQFIEEMAARTGRKKKDISNFINEFTDTVVSCLENEDKINLQPLGVIHLTKKNTRMGKDPQTGDDIIIKAARCPKLNFSKVIKKQLKHINLEEN